MAVSMLALSVAVVAGPGAAAQPAPTAKLPPAAVNNPDVPLATILALPKAIQQNATIHIDPDLDPHVPIIYGDGTAVPGQSAAAKAATTDCGIFAVWGPPLAWGPTYTGTCAVAGSVGFHLTYWWTKSQNVTTSGAADGTGWNPGQTWYQLGSTPNVHLWVPWGNVLAMPKGKAWGASAPAGITLDIHY
ncbi:MAG: hypothetical protein J0I11_01305 [Actinobacteria bacterium]|nr:hypothetical protein [Actinomycetota bacterium]